MTTILSPYTYLMKKTPCISTSIPRVIFPSLSTMAMPKNTRTLKFYLSQNDRKEIDKDDQRYGMASF